MCGSRERFSHDNERRVWTISIRTFFLFSFNLHVAICVSIHVIIKKDIKMFMLLMEVDDSGDIKNKSINTDNCVKQKLSKVRKHHSEPPYMELLLLIQHISITLYPRRFLLLKGLFVFDHVAFE
jgi:hypothetical protein